MKWTPRHHPADDVAALLQRFLAEERASLLQYVNTSHGALVMRFQEHLVEFLREESTEEPNEPAGAGSPKWSKRCDPVREPTTEEPWPCSVEVVSDPTVVSLSPNLAGSGSTAESQSSLEWEMKPVEQQALPQDEETVQLGDIPMRKDTQCTRSVSTLPSSVSTSMQKVNSKASSKIRHSEVKFHSWAERCIRHPLFESIFAVLIFVSAVSMGLEQQYQGFDLAYKMSIPGYRPAEETWPHARSLFLVAENFFGVVFTLEVVLKLVVLRVEFFRSFWNLYDTTIILFWIIQNLTLFAISVDPLVLRLARMCRLLRLLRFVKAFQVFDVLHLLVHSLLACMTALMWSMVFLMLVMIGTSIIMIYLLEDEVQNPNIPIDQRLLLYKYFGNFSNGLFSMYELTMGNWVNISRCVVDNVSEWFILFFVIYRTLVGFAVLKVITAIFNSETFRISQSDDAIMVMHKERQIAIHTRRMQALLLEGDESEDGYLSLEEFKDLLGDPRVLKWLAAQEIEVKDISLAFKMIDESGDGRISPEELVRGFSRLKGAARSIDIVTIMHAFHRLEVMMDRLEARVDNAALQDCREEVAAATGTSKRLSMVLKNNVSGGFIKRTTLPVSGVFM
eukprot:TRINITY_DN25461_c0_g1_i3.p1 TRINITY_DN25461_c0_g1~~TRINITY_DN25461_c0_g1_i3.p1  ORF type:complete len:619 (-),score=99.82 TRINITY_DN25461_c0_g1_i3:411-2267(-)